MPNALISFLLESGVCLLAFFGLYQLLLLNETCFRYNRLYLLAATVLSFLLPLLEVPTFAPIAPVQAFVPDLTPIFVTVSTAASTPEAAAPFRDWELLFIILYGCGFSFFAFRFVRQLYTMRRFVKSHLAKAENRNGITILYTNDDLPTFSFFRYIFFDNTQKLTTEEQERIL